MPISKCWPISTTTAPSRMPTCKPLLNLGRQSTSGGGSSEVASSAVPSNPSEITSGYSNNADVVADSGNTMTMDGVSVSGVRLDVNANRDATGPVIRSARTPTAATALSLISRAVAPESSATPGLDDRVDRVEAIVGNVATQLSSTNELEYDQFWPKQRETTVRRVQICSRLGDITRGGKLPVRLVDRR